MVVAERTAELIRKEIAAEHEGLHQDLDALKARLRSLLPLVVAGLLVCALLVVALVTGIRKLRKLH